MTFPGCPARSGGSIDPTPGSLLQLMSGRWHVIQSSHQIVASRALGRNAGGREAASSLLLLLGVTCSPDHGSPSHKGVLMAHILFEQLLGVTCSPDHGSPSHKGVLMAHILFEQLLESQPLPRGGHLPPISLCQSAHSPISLPHSPCVCRENESVSHLVVSDSLQCHGL